MTKVIAINGSPRKDGNTAILIRIMLEELENENIRTELIQLAGENIRGCTACMQCIENKDRRCVFNDDIVNDCIEKMAVADGIILDSPVYFSDVTAEMKALIDRVGFVSMANDGLFKRKGGTVVVAAAEWRDPFARYAVLFPAQPGRDRFRPTDGWRREGYRKRLP